MRITEILTEDQLDEVTAGQVGQGIGKVAGNVVRGTKDFFSGIKTGYQQGKTGQPAQPQASDSSATSTGAAPAGGDTAASGSSSAGGSSGSNVKFSAGPTAVSAGDSLDPDSLENIKSLVSKLNPTQKQEIAKAIEQGSSSGTSAGSSAPTASGSAQASAPDAGAKAFGQMASQLTPPSTSSTGGTTTQTPTGVKHTANPNNPNQPKAATVNTSDFDDQYGVPLTPAGAQKFLNIPDGDRMKQIKAAKDAGYTYDNQTGVFTPPDSGSAKPAAPDTSGAGAMRQFMNTVTPKDETPPADAGSTGAQSFPVKDTPVPQSTDAAKLTKQQQDAKKAELLGRRQAGASMATQTGGGFQNYVAGSGERMTGVDDQGAPVFKKIQREATFKSKFLEMDI